MHQRAIQHSAKASPMGRGLEEGAPICDGREVGKHCRSPRLKEKPGELSYEAPIHAAGMFKPLNNHD